MNQEKIGKLIKELRLKSNLTQNDFAKKYNVTYQAVSKWETGKNLPDMLILKQICKDYNINIDDILEGNNKPKKKNSKILYILLIIAVIISTTLSIYIINKYKTNQNFELKILSSNCKDFKLDGSVAYNNNRSVIHISKIEYCGENKDEIYQSIECNLYEINNKIETNIGSCNIDNNEDINLENYFKNVTININNEQKLCKDYNDNNLYLELKAINKFNKPIIFSIPLSVDQC